MFPFHPQDQQDRLHRPHPSDQPHLSHPQDQCHREDQCLREDLLHRQDQCLWESDQLHPETPSVPEIQLDPERLSHPQHPSDRPDRLGQSSLYLHHPLHFQRPPRQTDWGSHTQDSEAAASLFEG
jgi:hypothetical protein